MIDYLSTMPIANDSTRTFETRLPSDAIGIKAEGGRASVLRGLELSQDSHVSRGSDSAGGSESKWAIQDSNLYRHPDGGGPNNRQDSPPIPADESDLQDEAAFGRAFEAWRRARRETGGGR